MGTTKDLKKLKKKEKKLSKLMDRVREKMASFLEDMDDAFQQATEGPLPKVEKKLKKVKDPYPDSEF